MSWECFVITRSDRCQQYLRRYHMRDEWKAGEHFHEAANRIEDGQLVENERGYDVPVLPVPGHDDPRWPAQCSCGYPFTENDAWQLFTEDIYVDDQDREYTQRDAPTGAMWRASWMEDAAGFCGPDGQCWALMLPPGGDMGYAWIIDGPSSSGGHWQRTGTPPKLTARPSINRLSYNGVPGYHGWLTDGVLSDDIEGRTYGESS